MNSSFDNSHDDGRNGETQALTGDLRRAPDYTSGRKGGNSPTSDNEGNDLDDPISSRSLAKEKSDTSGALFGLNERSSVTEKIYYLSGRSAPVIISFFLSLSGSLINLLFAGRFVPTTGDRSIVFAGISLGNMFANVTCFSLLIGMSSAIETLGSQHNGAGNYEKVGLVFQRSCLILLIMTIPMLLLWMFVGNLYEYLGAEQGVCDVIRNYIYIRALGVPGDVLNLSYEKYLMSIGVMTPSMWCNISFNVFLLIFDSIFVFAFKLDYHCLAVAWVMATYLSALVQISLA
eukprot:gene22742-25762_t